VKPAIGFATSLAIIFSSQTARAYDLMALWESRSASVTDTFYTTYFNDHRLALNLNGAAEHGVAAYLPCSLNSLNGPFGEVSYKGTTGYEDSPSGDTVTPSRYTHGYSARTNWACAQPAGSVPLYRMYKFTPETDHLYTTSASEVSALESRGYGFDRVEGYLFTSQVAGSTALYRLRKGNNIAGQDAEHRYTLSTSARQSLLSAGWTDEGIIGYAFSSYVNPTVAATGFSGTLNGTNISPTTTVSVPIRNVVPPTTALTVGGNSGSSQYGTYASYATTRPSGAVWQNLTFSFYTGSWFPATPSSSALNHMPLYLHYTSQSATNSPAVLPPYDGIAMVFVPGNSLNGVSCAGTSNTGGQIFMEIGQVEAVSCASNLSTPLQNNTWYKFSYSLNDAAQVRISATNLSTGQPLQFIAGGTEYVGSFASAYACPIAPPFGGLSADNSYCANPFSQHGFPVANTGYFWAPVMSSLDISAKISDVKAQWLNASLVPIP